MASPVPPEALAALRRAGSRALPRGARAVLLRRLRRYGADAERYNLGGVRSGERGSGRTFATFADYDAGARRLVELSRILAGEHPFAAMQGYEGNEAGGGTFVSLAPEHGAKPLAIEHWSTLMPGDRSGDPGTPGYEVGGVEGAARRRSPRPGAWHVLLARHRARELRAPALAAGPSTALAPLVDCVQRGHDFAAQLADMEGLFGPSDAAAHAFQDLAASWKALEAAPGAEKLPGWKMNHDAWAEFARAWKAGDDASPQCNNDCESGLRAQILTLQTMRDDADKILPGWSAKVAKDLSLDKAKGTAWSAVEKGREKLDEAEKRAPALRALEWLGKFLAGEAPRWQYGAAVAGGVVVAGAVVRAYLPRSSASG